MKTLIISATLNKEKARQIFAFDMDGTLYQLDGPENGFSGSSLEKTVNQNILEFICQTETCSQKQAQSLLESALRDPVGASNFFSNRYGISRTTFFESVWDIDPQPIIYNWQPAVETIKTLAQSGQKLILLTSAPKVWQRKVISFLGLDGYFESIYTGEDFQTKEEIFAMLAKRYKPRNITSIGDQLKTDIEPATALGLQTLLVADPSDTLRLLEAK